MSDQIVYSERRMHMKRGTVLSVDIGNIRIRVSLGGFRSVGDKTHSLMHNHANFEYHMILQGSARFDTEEYTYPLMQDDAVLVFPYAFHRFSDQSRDSAVLSFSFSVSKVQKSRGKDYYSAVCERLNRENIVLTIAQDASMADELRKIMQNIYSEKLFAEEETKALLILLFSKLLSHLSEDERDKGEDYTESAEYDARIYMIEEYFNEYYMEDITLRQLSELLGLSEKQTERMIDRAFGEGFQQHLCRMRLKMAQDLLRGSDTEVKEIAETIGYRSYNGFYLAFKKNLGCTPMEYRRMMQGTDA